MAPGNRLSIMQTSLPSRSEEQTSAPRCRPQPGSALGPAAPGASASAAPRLRAALPSTQAAPAPRPAVPALAARVPVRQLHPWCVHCAEAAAVLMVVVEAHNPSEASRADARFLAPRAGTFTWGGCSFSFNSGYNVGLVYNTTFSNYCPGMAGTTPSTAQCKVLVPANPNALAVSMSWCAAVAVGCAVPWWRTAGQAGCRA